MKIILTDHVVDVELPIISETTSGCQKPLGPTKVTGILHRAVFRNLSVSGGVKCVCAQTNF